MQRVWNVRERNGNHEEGLPSSKRNIMAVSAGFRARGTALIAEHGAQTESDFRERCLSAAFRPWRVRLSSDAGVAVNIAGKQWRRCRRIGVSAKSPLHETADWAGTIETMSDPRVDITIAVHSASRPVARAVASVLDHTVAPVRVNVVAHNIDPEIIRTNLGRFASDPRLRLLELRDGIPSPAGPMNFGFASSTAPFISVMGSDDELAPGAIDSWLAVHEATRAEVVIAKIQLADGRTDPYPPVRNGRRTRALHGRRDRLAYRSAPLGLIDRARFGELRLTEGLPSGEDLAYSLTLWFTGQRLAYDLDGPAYVINDDASDRVTASPRPLAQDFSFLDELESFAWFARASRADRIAIVVKLIRIHVFDAVLARIGSAEALAENRSDILALLDRFEHIAPGATALLSLADRRVFDALRDPSGTPADILRGLEARHAYLSVPTLLTRNPFLALRAQAPFRTLFAGFRIMNGKR